MDNRGRGALRPWQWLLVVVLSLLSGGAMALGLGQIRVLSAPGQPLLAEIPIISNEPGELDYAQARLASPETFRRVGLQPPEGLVRDLQFEITADAQGRAVVRVSSTAPVDVAVVPFLIEVDWGQGRLVREYSALVQAPTTVAAVEAPVIQGPQALPADMIVDEPVAVAADAGVQAPSEAEVAPPVRPEPPAPAPAPPRPSASGSVAATAAGDVLAQVRRGQTLSGIASGLGRPGYTLDQTMLALLHANPDAFINGNINRLRAGAVLRMPDEQAFASHEASVAAALVREQAAQWRQASRPVLQPAQAAPPVPGQIGPAGRTASSATPAVADARLEIAPAAAAPGARSTESGLGAGGEGDMLGNEQLRQAQEDLAARDTEVQELQSRLAELEKIQQQQQKLIELKDTELAGAQQRLAELQQSASGQDAAAMPAWGWALVGLLVLAVIGFWFARRPKPLPIPAAPAARGGWDAAALAAAVPAASTPVPAPPAPVAAVAEPVAPAFARQDLGQPGLSSVPAWHTDEAPAPGLGSLNPAPAGRERLELAIAYLDLGDVETARTLLQEVAGGPDPAARDEASQLLRELG